MIKKTKKIKNYRKIGMKNENKRIWIDLENSPHVLFFYPIVKALIEENVTVLITARDCYQVIDLAKLYRLDYIQIGRHSGKNNIAKVIGTLYRAAKLIKLICKYAPDLSLSHFSRSQMIAATILRIPYLVFIDYEYSQKIPFINPTAYIIPEVVSRNHFKGNVLKYPGIKEYVYAKYISTNENYLKKFNINKNNIIVVLRPPAEQAHYHNNDSEHIYRKVLNRLAEKEDVQVIILPRNADLEYNKYYKKYKNEFDRNKFIFPENAVNGIDLINQADLVISGGGTMNREAAALNTPVYSFFKGKTGAVDSFLCKTGKLKMVETEKDVYKIVLEKKRVNIDNISDSSYKRIMNLIRFYLY